MEHAHTPTSNRQVLVVVFALTLLYLVVEIIVGFLTGSLALIADAVHMFTDAGALALAAFASWMAEKPATPQKTYGYYRVEILAALINGVILSLSALYIAYEAYQRFRDPQDVIGGPMLIAAGVGLVVNLVGVWLLHARSQGNLNMQGALYEVVKDALGSIGVIVAGIVILTTGFTLIDPLVSLLIGLLILPRTWKLLNEAVQILLEATPSDVDLNQVQAQIEALDHVIAVHDLHVWTITSGLRAMSGHIVVTEECDRQRTQHLLEQIDTLLKEEFDVEHSTVQIEYRSLQPSEPAI